MNILIMALLIVALFLLYKTVYRRYWSNGLDCRLKFSSSEAFEGETLTFTKEITNAKPLPLPWVLVKTQMSRNLIFRDEGGNSVSDDYYQNNLFSMGMYQRITCKEDFICGRRGYYRIKSVYLSASDFLINSKTVKSLQSDASLTVFPRLIDSPELDSVFRQIYGEIEVRRFTNPDPFAFRGIREYQNNDDFRLINWKATARTGSPMVNVNAATASRELIILLGLEHPDEELLEESIRIAASAAEYFTSLGLPAGVVSNGCDVASKAQLSILPGSGSVHFYSILDMLARIDLTCGQSAMSDILATLHDTGPFYLLISSYDWNDLADAFDDLLARGADARWIVPAFPDDNLRVKENSRITRWEVPEHGAPASFYKRDVS